VEWVEATTEGERDWLARCEGEDLMPLGLGGTGFEVAGSEMLVLSLVEGTESGFVEEEGGGMVEDDSAFGSDIPFTFVPLSFAFWVGVVDFFSFECSVPFVCTFSPFSFSFSSGTVVPFSDTGASFNFFSFFFRFRI
jgi:hypothetical protein